MQRNIISQRKWANKQERGDIMAAFPEEWLNELLSKTDIVRVVGDYVSLTPKGGRFWGCCPFHNEKTPSFSVTPEKQMYYCFGCHAGGGVIHFVMEAERVSYVEAVKLLAQRAGMELPDEVNDARLRAERAYKERLYNACKEAAIFYNKKLLSAEGKAAQEYLKRRGIGGKMAVRFGLGYAPEGWHNLMDYLEQKGYSRKEMVDAGLAIASKKDGRAYDAYRERLIYPIISATGRVMAFGARTMKKDDEPKYINTGDTPIYNKRYNLYALNMQRGKRVGELIMVEGYMDVISLFAAGIENAVASLGTAMTQQQARLIKRYADKMYLCYDGDSAGQAATLRGLDILSAEGIDPKVIVIPGNMDPDDYVRKFGKNGFLELRDSALDANTFRLTNMAGKYDLKTPDGREEFAKKACAFVGSLQPVERERHIAFISKRTGLSEAVVKAQCGLFAAGIENMPAKSRNTMGKARKEAENEWDSAELTILSLMLMDADTATYTAAAMMESGVELQNEAIRSAAEELLIKYAGGENTSTAVMISELEPMQAEAVSAAEAQAEKIKGDVRQIADDCVKRMLKAKLSAELEDEFAKASGLEGEERKQSLNKANEIAKKLKLLR